ncbi:hypothetical protein M878_09710 [Streptomyces roseochromogenus subsp. oscitans DS 12.976]|uniref:histidine kinase n=1 Tax=Streptomyces roseochromogenus subsp. oscitans DS 12.976 TaxID=1352936 RepID=V6KR89_STRRC|nr:hypothetical protein M878_09710 [Streptomyces roseochromogenus subsp. oscitans DS 12.976]
MEKVRLLVVDDDPPIADLVATVARYEGREAACAYSGEEALRRAAEFGPDIVVLDLMLPDVDGFGVLDRLRRSGTMVPVVFLTARDGVADRVAGLTRGGDDYLVKPFAVEELRTAFNTMLEHIDDSLAVRAEAERRLRRFVADASHELRTPLMSVRGYADLFQYASAGEPAERDRHLARLRSEAARMGVLLDELLRLARLDAAEVETPLRCADTDLTELVREAADAFRASHPGHPLTMGTGTGPVRLHLDPVRIRQVLDNLLTNAAVHTPPGTEVALTVSADAAGVYVRVADAGPGIPETERARVFDRFYRVDKARSRDRGGGWGCVGGEGLDGGTRRKPAAGKGDRLDGVHAATAGDRGALGARGCFDMRLCRVGARTTYGPSAGATACPRQPNPPVDCEAARPARRHRPPRAARPAG